jgi:SAM-dependent methyltransferase
MRWQYRLLLDKVKGLVPAQESLRRAKRRICGFHPDHSRDKWAIDEGIKQVQWVGSVIDLRPARLIEIGSGWQPIIPLLYSLAGTGEVIMTDLKRLCHSETLTATVNSMLLHKAMIAGQLSIQDSAFERLAAQNGREPLERSLERFSIRYRAPCDFRKTGLPANSVDAVVSRSVLEHIPEKIVAEIFREGARILRSGGVMCHFVDNSDHWEHTDRTISRVNFLRFPDHTFRWMQSDRLYQNRLRHPEYAELLRNSGVELRREERIVDSNALAALDSLPIAARFQRFSKEDLAALDSYFLAVKP